VNLNPQAGDQLGELAEKLRNSHVGTLSVEYGAADVELDMRLEVAFEKLDDKITLPMFRPAKG